MIANIGSGFTDFKFNELWRVWEPKDGSKYQPVEKPVGKPKEKDCKDALCAKDICPDGSGRKPFGDNCCSCERKPTTKPTKPKKKPTPFVIPAAMKMMIK